ncbi:hydrophobe/amphiphile efflux-1 (HAE1) family protein [Duganella sp. 1411]|uniref:efflux RND transporter permease subunit n=1 Tax=Duganella sp. 1411 TaxID=2806572 RepID=UPI001AE891CA|nr:efflux RND transporter permease subunit [Duganella sp. 1411]MBP1205043.1 hydrophobe/amphiphile efflux-1 (HAE1) family protein [Duganella sp. 1411]
MRFSQFFIRRPVFAIVLSILVTLVGAVSALRLPISEYPEIVPPTVTVKATYPGASAQEIADTVAAPIEQEINGVDGMLYLSSQSVGDGKLTISVVFKPGTDVEQAQSLVQNRVAVAESRLPEAVRRLGLAVKKSSPDLLMVVLFDSPEGTRDQQYISNFIGTAVKDKLARVEGVGDIYSRGARDFSMRIWLDPARVAARGLSGADVIAAVRQANSQVAAGALNQPPGVDDGGAYQVQVQAQSRLRDVAEFESIVVAAPADGGVVRLRDVARVEMGAQDYTESGFVDNRTAIALGINLLPGANALATGERVLAELERMRADFPRDVAFHAHYNPTKYIRASIDKVRDTIFEAALLVCLAMLLFLGSWRAAVIPILAIPVSLVGTFAVLGALGYSLNTLSLFGLVLAIGIVVDDAIVVVENVERHMEEGLGAVAAAQRSMDEVGFALIAIALVLVAVFVPTAFIDGISGMFYRQFAVTIAASTVISALTSLTLSPALAALLLKPRRDPNALGARWMRVFNGGFARLTGRYVGLTGRILSRRWLMLPVYLAVAGLTVWRLDVTPRGFVPQLDRGYAIVSIQLPAGSTLARTSEVVRDATARLMSHPGVAHTAAFVGTDGATFTSAPNAAVIFTMYKDFGDRASDGLDGPAMLGALRGKLAPISAARVMVIPPPSVPGIGTGGGFKLILRDTAGLGPQALQAAARGIVAEASKLPSVMGAFTPYNAMSPQIKVDIDRTKAEYLGVPLQRVNETLQSYMAPVFVNDMNLMGRVWRVTAQADAPYRRGVADLAALKTRANDGAMVPLGGLATFSEGTAPFRVPRYNLYPGAEIQGNTRQGYSTGQTIAAMEALLKARLPAGFDYEWTELALQEKHAGGSTGLVLGLAVLLVYLLLAALFESWLLPLSVVLIVPSCVLATLLGVSWRGLDNNVLTQISIVVLIGLAAKNAILIVEFARQAMAAGADARAAAIGAARTRLRPILMTSLAFLLGAIPLMFSTGPGAEMRQSMGTAVFAGMLGVTLSGLLFTPLFFTVLSRRRAAPALRAAPVGEAA